MPLFLCQLRPPRPSFSQDMSAAEGTAMQAHAAYWTALLRDGSAVAFGPVADPAGVWGLAIVEAADGQAVAALAAGDPAVLARIGLRYDIHPMPDAVARPRLGATADHPLQREGAP